MKFARMFLFFVFIVAMIACGKTEDKLDCESSDSAAVDLPKTASETGLSADATADKD